MGVELTTLPAPPSRPTRSEKRTTPSPAPPPSGRAGPWGTSSRSGAPTVRRPSGASASASPGTPSAPTPAGALPVLWGGGGKGSGSWSRRCWGDGRSPPGIATSLGGGVGKGEGLIGFLVTFAVHFQIFEVSEIKTFLSHRGFQAKTSSSIVKSTARQAPHFTSSHSPHPAPPQRSGRCGVPRGR